MNLTRPFPGPPIHRPPDQRAATAGHNTIKLVDVKGWKEIEDETTVIDPAFGKISGVAWTDDGQILTVATRNGTIFNFLTRMPTVFDCHGSRVAYMSSLREMTVKDTRNLSAGLVSLPVSVEPSFVALGGSHVAVGMNNRVWFHRASPDDRKLVSEREYLSTVDAVKMSSKFAAVLCEGKVNVHLIEPGDGEDPGTMVRAVLTPPCAPVTSLPRHLSVPFLLLAADLAQPGRLAPRHVHRHDGRLCGVRHGGGVH